MAMRIYQNEIALTGKTDDEIKEEMMHAVSAGVELNFENCKSYIMVRVEADEDQSAVLHKLLSVGFSPVDD